MSRFALRMCALVIVFVGGWVLADHPSRAQEEPMACCWLDKDENIGCCGDQCEISGDGCTACAGDACDN